MHLKNLRVVFVAVSIAHASAALGQIGGQTLAPTGDAAQAISRADHLATSPDLAVLEKRIQSVIEKASPSIVWLGSEAGTGTGAIISPDGLILTQGHLLGHPVKAGLKFWPRFHDGAAAEAEVVGADRLHDLALLRLVKAGTYPFIPLAEYNAAPGTGVVKFGFPFEAQTGYPKTQMGRPVSVRFGVVLATKSGKFVTDCAIDGGDSGGPFIDLEGRMVGIVGSAMPIRDEPTRFPLHHNLSNTRGRYWFSGVTATLVHERLARMAKGEFPEPTAAEQVENNFLEIHVKEPILYRDLIAENRWTQGKNSLGRFRSAVADVRKSVIEVLDGDEPVARGTVVDPAGLVITKASALPEKARCRLPDGRVVSADVVGVDPAYDLVLLRVPADGLTPVTWAKKADLPAGTLLAAAGTGELPAAVGIVSISRRDTPGPHPSTPYGYERPDLPASPPELTGSTVKGGGFAVETSEGNAAAAGIRPGDIILKMAGKPLPDNAWLEDQKVGMIRYDLSYYTFQTMLPLLTSASDKNVRRAGEQLPVILLRRDKKIELSLKLPPPAEKEVGFVELMVWSRHYDPPPTVITADIPVYRFECGAPAVTRDGAPIGLVMSRFGPTGSFIIPGDRVAARLADLKLGKPLPDFPKPAATSR